MKIERLHIDNFGRLQNFDLDFAEGINQICNENGWGKSTLSIFIKAMFYGMGAGRDNIKNERKKYMPWQGGNFGGYVDFSCEKGKFRIVRNFAKTPEGDESSLIDLNKNVKVELPKEDLGTWLFGVGKDTFEMTAFFPQLKFASGANEQISAGVLGLDKFKYDLASVGDALSKIKKEISAAKKEDVKQSEIDRLNKTLSEIRLDFAACEKAIKETQAQLAGEKEKKEACQKQVETEKNTLQQLEKVYSLKVNIENEIKTVNEAIASLLLAKREEKHPKQKPSILPVLIAAIVVVAMVVLGVTKILSWIICGIVILVALVGAALSYLLINKPKQQAVQIDDGQEKIALLQSKKHELEQSLQNFKDIQKPSRENFEKVQEQLFAVQLGIERTSSHLSALMRQKDRIQSDIESMTESIENMAEQKKEAQEKLQLLSLTSEYLSQAKENVSARFVGPINNGLGSILSRFDMRHREYVVDVNFDIKERQAGSLKPFELSSQGYQDLLSFAMRILLVGQVFKGEKPLIILDDTFVNLDDENKPKAKQLLQDIAKEYQILYVCCNAANLIDKN